MGEGAIIDRVILRPAGRRGLPARCIHFFLKVAAVFFLGIYLGNSQVCRASETLSRLNEIVHGSLKIDYTGYLHRDEKQPHQHWMAADLKLELSKQFTETLSCKLHPRLRFDTAGFARGVAGEFPDESGHRHILDLDEAWVRHVSGRWEVVLGKNIFSWGTADAYNPTAVLNPVDGTDIPGMEKMGVGALAVTWFGDLATLESVIIPWFTPTRLAAADNRWSVETGGIDPGDTEFPDKTVENAQFALRLSSSTLVDGWDLSLSYFNGYDPVGVFRMDIVSFQSTLTRVFPRVCKVGADFSTTFNNFEFHGEGAARFTRNDDMDDDYVEYVMGVNYEFHYWIRPPSVEEMSVLLEYAGTRVFDKKTETERYLGAGWYDRPFENTILGNIRVKFSESVSLKIGGGVNLDDSDYFLEPVFTYKFTDTLKLDVGGYIINGRSGSTLHHWHDNDQVSVTLTRYF